MTEAASGDFLSQALVIGAVLLGAALAFFVIRKIVKWLVSLVLILLLAAVALVYCVKAGYLSGETAERLNPLKNDCVREVLRKTGAWAGDKAKDAAKEALSEVLTGAAGGAGESPADNP